MLTDELEIRILENSLIEYHCKAKISNLDQMKSKYFLVILQGEL